VSSQHYRGKPFTGPDAPGWTLTRSLRVTVARVLLGLYRTRVEGVENIPAGGAMLAGNHVSYLDPALLWSVAPRPVHFVAKAELWNVGWLGWALDRVGAFPVERGSADRAMITTATDLLSRGELVGMFPEGTRSTPSGSGELGAAHGGVSFIAMRAGVPIVPVGIAGTDKALPRGAKLPRFPRVTIRFGEPVYSEGFEGGRKERIEAVTAELMRRIAAERDRARGAR